MKSNKQRVYRRVHKPKAERVVTGEPDAEKLACPVREGAVGKGLHSRYYLRGVPLTGKSE